MYIRIVYCEFHPARKIREFPECTKFITRTLLHIIFRTRLTEDGVLADQVAAFRDHHRVVAVQHRHLRVAI